MADRPPKWAFKKAETSSFRRLRDGNRYGAEWQTLSRAMLRAQPVCHCDRVRVWFEGAVKEVAMAPEGKVAPAQHCDHIRPLNMGGTNSTGNLQTLCHSCHSKKTAKWG